MLAAIAPFTSLIEELCIESDNLAALAAAIYFVIPITRTAARITMIAITSTISTRVKPFFDF